MDTSGSRPPAAPPAAPPAVAPAAPAGRSAIDGAWVPVAATVCNQPLIVAELRVARLVLHRGAYDIVDQAGRAVDRGRFVLDDADAPHTMDLIGLEGPFAGRTMLAALERDGDRLTVCYDLEASDTRPGPMPANGEQLLLRITYARVGAGLS